MSVVGVLCSGSSRRQAVAAVATVLSMPATDVDQIDIGDVDVLLQRLETLGALGTKVKPNGQMYSYTYLYIIVIETFYFLADFVQQAASSQQIVLVTFL